MNRYIIVFILYLFIIFNTAAQSVGDYRSITNGNWSNSTTWEVFDGSNWNAASDYPGQNGIPNTVSISSGTSVTLDVSPAFNFVNLIISGSFNTDNTIRTLTIDSLYVNGSFDLFYCNLTVNGSTVIDGALTDGNDNGNITFVGKVTINNTGSFSTANASNFTFNGGIDCAGTFNKTGTGNITFGNNQTIHNLGNNTMIFNGNVTNSDTLTIQNNTSGIIFGNNFINNSNLTINNNAAITFNGSFTTTANVLLGGTAAISFNNSVTISGANVISNQNSDIVTITGILNGTVAGSTWVNDTGSTLNYTASGTAPMATGVLNASAVNNTVVYGGIDNVFKYTTYHHLVLRLPATATANVQRTLTADLTINGNLTIESLHGTYTNELNSAGRNVTINGSTTINARGLYYDRTNGGINTFGGLVIINNNGTFNTTASTTANTVIFQGGITNNGSFTINTSTFSTNSQSIVPNSAMTFGGAVLINSNVTIENGSGVVTFSGAVTIGNDIVFTNKNSAGITITGVLNGINANSTYVNDENALLTYNNVTAPMLTGVFDADQNNNTVFYNLNGAQTIRAVNYYHLQVALNTNTLQAGDFVIYGNLTVQSGILQFASNANNTIYVYGDVTIINPAVLRSATGGSNAHTLYIGGKLNNGGSFTMYNANNRYVDVVFTGSGTVITGNGAYSLRNIIFTNTGNKEINTTSTINLNFGGIASPYYNVIRNSGGELSFSDNSTVQIIGPTGANVLIDSIGSGSGSITFYNLQFGTGATQNINAFLGTNVRVISNIAFNQSPTSFLSLNSYRLTIDGNYSRTNNGLLRGTNNSVLVINGSGNPTSSINFDITTPGTTNLFRKIIVNRSAGTVTFSNQWRVDSLEIQNGTLTTGADIYINSSYENAATFNQTAGTIYFNKSGSIAINGNNTFYNATLIANNTVINNSSSCVITNSLDGLSANSVWINNDNSTLTYLGTNVPMNTGQVVATASNNTIDYNRNGAQTVKPTTYFNLTLSNANIKTLAGPIIVNGTFTVSGSASIATGTNNVTLNGATNYTSSAAFTTGNNVVVYGGTTNQVIIPGSYATLNTTGSGVKTLNSQIVNVSTAINIGAGTVFEVNEGAQLRASAANVPITNQGTFKVVGTSSNYAVVSRVNAGNSFTYVQNTASAIIMARYYRFWYLSGGLTITNGSVDATNNFSDGEFQYCTGQQVMDLTGVDLTGLPDVQNVIFYSGTTYNVSRTSGTGSINFVDASGSLAGEAYDNDNGNPGTLINWTYPSRVYYSRGNLPVGLTTSWSKNRDGSGANPPSVTGGDLVFIIRDGDNMVLDNQGNMNALQLIVGEGISGSLTIGNNATATTLTIQEKLEINSGASVIAGSSATHAINLYGNIINNGLVNLKSGSNQVALNIYGITSQISGNSPTLADLTLQANSRLTAATPLNVAGNVTLNTGSILYDNNLTHTITGNWLTAGTGQLNGQGTIVFNTNGLSTIGGTAPVTFYNLICNGSGVTTLNANIQVNNNFTITNAAQFIVANYTDFIAGNFTVDALATYNHSSGTTNFNGSNPQTINLLGNVTFNALTFSGTGNKLVNGNITAKGLVTISNGSTVEGTGTHTFYNGLRGDGTCNFSGKVIMRGGNIYNQTGPVNFTLGTAELEINGNVLVTVVAPSTNIQLNVNNHVTVTGGYLVLNQGAQLIGQPAYSFTVNPGYNLYLRDVNNFPTGFGTYNLVGAYTRYDMNGDQTVAGNITYGYLYLYAQNGTTSSIKTASGNIEIRNDLNFVYAACSTTFNMNGYDLTITGNVANVNSSILDASAGGTVTFNNAGHQTFGLGTYRFNNVIFSINGAANGIWNKAFATGSNITILGNFEAVNVGGSSSVIQNINLQNIALTGGNPINLNLGDYCRIQTSHPTPGTAFFDLFTGTKTLADSSYVYYALQSANVVYGGTAQYIADGITYGNIIIDVGDKIAEGPLTINGSFLSIGGTYNPPSNPNYPVFVDNGFTHRIRGNWYLDQFRYFAATPNYGTMPSPVPPPSATGTIIFDGINQSIVVNNTMFNHVIVNNTGTLTLPGSFNCNIYADLTLLDGSIFNAGNGNVLLRGNFINSGTGRFYQNTGTFTFNSTTSDQTIQTNDLSYFGNLTINKPTVGAQRLQALTGFEAKGNVVITTNAGILDITNQTVKIGGNLTVNNNTVITDTVFVTNGSTVIFNGENSQQIIRNDNQRDLTFNNIVFTGSVNKSFGTANAGSNVVVVKGDFSILGGITVMGYTAGLTTIQHFYVAGNWINTGTFTHLNGTNANYIVHFNGNNQTISSTNFSSVEFIGSGTKTLDGVIVAASDFIIGSNVTVDANGNDISVGRNWVNNNTGGVFIHGNNTVTFNSNNGTIYTGTNSGPIPGKTFYNVTIAKNITPTPYYADLNGHLVVENDLAINSGVLRTNANNHVWVGGNFSNPAPLSQSPTTSFVQDANSNIYFYNSSGGTKTIDANGASFSGMIINAPGTTYNLLSDLTVTNNDTLLISAGTLSLNSRKLTASGNPYRIIINGGKLNIDSIATLEFGGTLDSLILLSGELITIGKSGYEARITKVSGNYFIRIAGGKWSANYYSIDGIGGGAGTYGLTITGSAEIDAVNNLSNGTFSGGTGAAYINLSGWSFSDFTINGVKFNAGTGANAVARNVYRPIGNSGTVTFSDASGSLAGATFENDPANQVEWTYPSGVRWTNAAGTGEWSNYRNWSSNAVPDENTIVYLDHTFIAGSYTVNIDSAHAHTSRLVINYGAGLPITLQLRKGYNLYVNENLIIESNGTLTVENSTDTIYVKNSWTNSGTFSHGNSTVIFNGNVGTYSIVSGGIGATKSFYNLTINANAGANYRLGQPTRVENNLLIQKGILDQVLPSNYLIVNGNFTVNASTNGVFNHGSSNVVFAGSNQTIDCSFPFYNVVFGGTGTKELAANMDIDRYVRILSGSTFNGKDYTIYVGQYWSNFGNFTQFGSGTVVFDGSIAQNIDTITGVATTFNHITFNGTGGKTIRQSFQVKGDFIISGGITGSVNFMTNTVTGTDTGIFSITGATAVYFYGFDNFPTGFGNISLAQNSTVIYISDLPVQRVRMTEAWSYGNLTLRKQTLSGSPVVKEVLSGNLVVSGNLTIGDVYTQLDMATNNANMTLTGNIVFPTGGIQINWGTGTSTLTHVGGYWEIDPDITGFNNLILAGTNSKIMRNNLTITGNLDIRSNVNFQMYYQTNSYRIFGPGDTLSLADNALIYNTMPASTDTAFPTRFAVYQLSPNSTTVLNSPAGINQILFTGKNIKYGNLTFANAKTVTHDGLDTLIIKGNFNTNGSTYNDNPITPRPIRVAGANVRIDYYTATPNNKLTLDGVVNQSIYSAGNNTLNLSNLEFSGSYTTKTFGDGNDVVNISGNVLINSNVTVTSNRNITFSGNSWINNGIFNHTGGNFNITGTGNVIIDPGASNAQNYFNSLFFANGTSKRFINNGVYCRGRFAIRTNGLTVYMGTYTHTISGDSLTTVAGGILHSDSASFIFDRNGAQYINIPSFKANNVTTATGGIKYMLSDWILSGNLTIGSNTTLTTNTASYNIALGGNWINNGTFTYNQSTVTFNGNTSPVTIQTNGTAGGVNDFYYVNFNPTVPVTYNLTSAITRFRRSTTIGTNATLNLNGNTLYMGSNITVADKNLIINGTLNIDANSTLRINNQGAICNIDVYGRLNIVGTSMGTTANITTEQAARTGYEPIITVYSGATIAANYYSIEYLANSGLDIRSGANIDATNNFSNGIWRNIALNNARYLNIETDNIPNPAINNISFNIFGTPGTNVFNVSRVTATVVLTFDNVSGNLGSYQYENDAIMPPSCSTGLLRWPCIVTANWTGAISTDWHTAGNWDINQVPDLSTDVIIPDRPNDPKITLDSAKCKSLTITNGNLLLENNQHLLVNGDVQIGTGTNVAILAVNSSNSTITVKGSWTRGTNGIFVHGGGTVIFNSIIGTVNITPLSSRFNNIVIDNAASVYILNGATNYVDGSINIQSGTLRLGNNNYNLYVAGNFNVNTLANFLPTYGSVTAGTVIFNGNQDQTITNANFYNVTFDGTQSKVTQNNISIANIALVKTNATLRAEVGSTIDFNGNVTIEAGATFNDGGETHYFTGINWSNLGNYAGNGTLIFDRTAGAQYILNGDFGNIILQNYQTILQNNINVNGDLVLKNGTNYLNVATYLINNSSGTGTFTMEDNTRLYVRGANNFPSNFGLYDIGSTSTVYYDGSVNQSIYPVSYGTLVLQSNNTKTLLGDINIKSNLYLYNSTLDVSNNNYTINIQGNWYNNNAVSGIYGTFVAHQGEVIFDGTANQTININPSASNNFYHLTVNKSGGNVSYGIANTYTISGNLTVINGTFNNNQPTYIGGDLTAVSGTFTGNGTYYLNKTSGTANITTNGSQFLNITISSTGNATFNLNDDLDVRGNFTILSGTFNGNGKYMSLGDGATDAVNIQGTFIVGGGGTIALGNGTGLTVGTGGRIEIIGTPSNLAVVTHNTINGAGSRYSFMVDGTIAAKYALFEYMNAGGIFINTNGIIDVNNNFSYCTFNNGVNTGCMLRIENNQRLTQLNRIVDVAFPQNPGGSSYNVRKIVATTDTIEFYNSTGLFAGENYDDDPNELIIWTGPITLTWNGSISSDWNDSLNWTASYGPPIVPTGNENVIIATATNQPIITTYGAKTLNLTINSGAALWLMTPTDGDSIDLQVNGDLYVNGQLRLNSTNDVIGVTGNLTKGTNGSITNNGTVVMNGTGGAKVINTGTNSFYNLKIAGNTLYQLGANTTVRNDLTILPDANLDVNSSNNYVLTVGGNFINDGNFVANSGRVILNCNVVATKTIRSTNSAFYDLDISTSRATYVLDGNVNISHNASISNGGTLKLNGNILTFGNINAATENFNINGTLDIDANATLRMGNSSYLIVNSGGTVKLLGSSINQRAKITAQNVNTSGFGFSVNSGGSVSAKFYTIEYIDINGLRFYSGSNIDAVNNLSEGIFSYGRNGGVYLRFDNNFGGINDSIRNVVFNAPVSGTMRNVYRTTGTDLVVMVDASGEYGSYEYEFDVGCPGAEDPNAGLIRWVDVNTYYWTGATNTDWFTPTNWSSGQVPDSSKFAVILNVPNKPVINGAQARARKVTIKTGSSLTVYTNLRVEEELLYFGTVTAVGTPTIYVGDTWTSSGGTFNPGNSTVILGASSGTKDIKQGTSSFYNLSINAGSGTTYRLTTNTILLGSLIITGGTLNSNGYDMTIGGGWSNTGGAFVSGTRTVTFNAASGTHNINPGSSSFYNVIINSGNGSGNATFTLGNTSAYTIYVTNNFTLSKGTVDLSPDNGVTSNNLSIGNRYSSTSGTLSARNGIITVGENWSITGTGTFVCGNSIVQFTANSGTKNISPRGQSFYNLSLIGNATFRISNTLDVDNNLTISNGILDVSTSPSYNIFVGGNWLNNSVFIPQSGTVIFDGSNNQTLTKTGGETYYNLTINKSAGELIINNHVTITNALTFTSGVVSTSTNKLILGTSTTNIGTLSRVNGHVKGNLERWINATSTDYLFPVGSSTEYHQATIRPVSGLTSGSLIVSYIEGDPGATGLPLDESSDTVIMQFNKGYWNVIAANSFACTNYNVSLLANYFTSGTMFLSASSRVLKRTNGGAWVLEGTHQDATITATDTTCHRLSLNGISTLSTQFAIGVTNCWGGVIAADQIICAGNIPATFTNVSLPRGGSGNYTYTWQYTTNMSATPGDGSWIDIPSSNSQDLAYPSPLSTSALFVRKVTALGCYPKYSNVLTITLYPTPNTGPLFRIPNKY